MAITNCNSGVKSISNITGRCALFNVKLHFSAYFGIKMAKIDLIIHKLGPFKILGLTPYLSNYWGKFLCHGSVQNPV